MRHWELRHLVALICLWTTGCGLSTNTAPTLPPTSYPPVTLTIRLPSTSTPFPTPLLPFVTTPLPSPTAASSPTPVVYTIQEGDSLLSIAILFDIDMQALQNANNGVDSRALQIGQPLIIPNPQLNEVGVPLLPTTTPLALTIEAPACYETSTGQLLCMGEVRNNQTMPIERASVLVQILNVQGQVLNEQVSTVEQMLLEPGATAPYQAIFAGRWQAYAGAAAYILSADAAQDIEARFANLKVEEQSARFENGRYIIEALVTNQSSSATTELRLVATLYSGERVAGYRAVDLPIMLAQNEQNRVRIDVVPQVRGTPLTHWLVVEARRN